MWLALHYRHDWPTLPIHHTLHVWLKSKSNYHIKFNMLYVKWPYSEKNRYTVVKTNILLKIEFHDHKTNIWWKKILYAIYGEMLHFRKSNTLRVKPTHCEQKYILRGKTSIFVSPIQCLKNQRTMKIKYTIWKIDTSL